MLTLTQPLESSFEFEGLSIQLDLSYDNVLRMYEVFDGDLFNDYEKVIVALQVVVIDYEPISTLSFENHQELFMYILREFMDIDTEKKEEDSPGNKVMDWKKDAGLIYASFLSEYKIDLIEQQGKLHWSKFINLLTSLGDKTAFKQVVGYRTMKVPTSKEASEEYRKHIQKMKETYSLEEPQDKLESLGNTLDTIASTFAGGGKK